MNVKSELTYAVNSTSDACRPTIRLSRATRSILASRMIRVAFRMREPSSPFSTSSAMAAMIVPTYVIGSEATTSTTNLCTPSAALQRHILAELEGRFSSPGAEVVPADLAQVGLQEACREVEGRPKIEEHVCARHNTVSLSG